MQHEEDEPSAGAVRHPLPVGAGQCVTVRVLLAEGARNLGEVTEARREAALLLCHVLAASDAWLVAHADDAIDAMRADAFRALVTRRAHGEPIAYLTGSRGFHAIDLHVTPDVLIPRPETELLVDLVLQRLPAGGTYRVADLGTGSGAIALALAAARPAWPITATDASPAALAVASANAQRLGLANVSFAESDWCVALGTAPFDLIVSNPPYIAAGDAHLRSGDLRFEPPQALASGADGLDAIRTIVRDAPAHLREGGWLLFEHGFDQGAAARALLSQHGYLGVFTARDVEQRERVSGGRRGVL